MSAGAATKALGEELRGGLRGALSWKQVACAMKSVWERKDNNFDFIRLALAVLVIYSHCFPLGVGSESREPFLLAAHGQMTGGAIAVDLFFIMSGFLIAASVERSRSMRDFFRKRVARIYPAFVVCALVCAVVVLPLASGSFAAATWLGQVGDFCLQTLRLREFSSVGAFGGNPYPGSVNGSVWSIQFEFWCYVGVAILSGLGLLRRRAAVLSLFVASVLVSVGFQVYGWIFGGKFLGVLLGSPQLWARLLPLYLAGVVFYLYRDRLPLSGVVALVSVAALVTACWMRFGLVAVFPLAGTYLVFYVAYAPWVRLHRFGRFGDVSYGTYLYAFPVEQMLMKGIGHAVAPWVLFWCATPLTLLCAVASWYGVERRFLRPGRRKEAVEHALEVRADQGLVVGRAES